MSPVCTSITYQSLFKKLCAFAPLRLCVKKGASAFKKGAFALNVGLPLEYVWLLGDGPERVFELLVDAAQPDLWYVGFHM